MQRVLALTKYNRLGASSRLRFLQYIELFQQMGISVDVMPLLRDRYLEILYNQGRRSQFEILVGVMKRMRDLSQLSKFDSVWLEGELLPWLPVSMERWLLRRARHLVVDYDDPIYLRYKNRSSVTSFLYAQKIEKIMRSATTVVAANSNLADHAREIGAEDVRTIPTVVDLDRYRFTPSSSGSRPPAVGWIGSPATSNYLSAVLPVLSSLAKSGSARVVLIGAGEIPVDSSIEVIDWQEENEIAQLDQLDIGIMPLPDDEWAKGKSGYKMYQYMAMSLPIVASPVGTSAAIIEEAGVGLLATDASAWSDRLEMLIRDRELRQKMGHRGRKLVEQKYNTGVMSKELASVLASREFAET